MKKIPLFWVYVLFLTIPCWADDASEVSQPESWNIHFQTTLLPEYHGSFPSAYEGANSLSSSPELNMSFTATLFLGFTPWKDGFLYIDPEVPAGSGFSNVTGFADFPNGEISKVGSEAPVYNQARLYFQQVLELGGEKEPINDSPNQLATQLDISRLTLSAGKFSLTDFFDTNAYANDARTQFMNIAFVDNCAWDYAADTHGYTIGLVMELNQKNWAFRFGEALVSTTANGSNYDWNLSQAHSSNMELEWRYGNGTSAGKIRFLAYLNNADMGSYHAALNASPSDPSVNTTRAYREKFGLGLNWEQSAGPDLGFFARLGWNDGQTQTWMFTAVDQQASIGLSLNGTRWGRPDDQLGLGWAISGLSQVHQAYLAAGGMDFDIGDGALNYAPERVVEVYYNLHAGAGIQLSPDFQFVTNPAYNQARGPVPIYAFRFHLEM